MVDSIWLNTYTRLWLIENGQKTYLPYAGVFRVMWHGQTDERVILHSPLPRGSYLLSIEDGAVFEVTFGVCKDPSEYDSDSVIARFTNCKTKRKWIRRPVVLSPDYSTYLSCHVEFSCSIEMFVEQVAER